MLKGDPSVLVIEEVQRVDKIPKPCLIQNYTLNQPLMFAGE